MKFAFPALLELLWVLPLLAAVIALGVRRKRRALGAYAEAPLLERFVRRERRAAAWVRGGLLLSAVFFLVVAAARPLLGVHYVPVRRTGVDVVIALDTSASMDAVDVRPSRLERAKQEIVELLGRLRGDRVGLVVFAGNAYVQCPLTLDYAAVRLVLDAVRTDATPVPGTALGEAIRISSQCFDPKERRYRALVLITDGEDHEGDPVGLAREAAEQGARIFTIGMGTPGGAPVPERDAEGNVAGYKKDASGQLVMSRLDESTLVRVAEAGHGRYVRAGSGIADRDAVYRDIAGMEEREVRGGFVAQYHDRFHYAVAIALVLLAIEAVWSARRSRAAVLGALVVLAWASPAHAGADSDVRKGNAALGRGDAAAALASYERAVAERPGDPLIRYDMGSALAALGRYDDAVAAFADASGAASPDLRADAHFNAGNTLFRQGSLADAADAYRRSLRERPDDGDARRNLELALRRLAAPPQQGQPKPSPGGQDSTGQKQDQPQKSPGDRGDEKRPGEQGSEQRPGEQREGERGDESRPRASEDSTSAAPRDSMQASRAGRLSREEAERILRALERAEQEAQRERMKARTTERRPGKDW